MENELYNAARVGNINFLEQVSITSTTDEESHEEITNENYFHSQTSNGDNILHIAASHGQAKFIDAALNKVQSLILLISRINSNGDNPLHIASRLGHLHVLSVLVTSYKSFLQNIEGAKKRSTLLSQMMAADGGAVEHPWRIQNSNGDTPLHDALRNGHQKVSLYLLQQVDQDLACYVNAREESPLYLAMMHELEDAAKMIISLDTSYSTSGPGEITPLHAALYCTESVAQLLLDKRPELLMKTDSTKMTALHYAADRGPVWLIKLLLKKDKSLAYLRDSDGYTPLLRASIIGRPEAVHAILLHCPQSIIINDINGKTALHLMKMNNYDEGVELLKDSAIGRLVNESDREGNTPLHLAVRSQDAIKARILMSSEIIEPMVKNMEGFTVLELIKALPELNSDMADIAYSLLSHATHKPIETTLQTISQRRYPTEKTNRTSQKNFTTLAVIASILTSISFAAILVIPGGFDTENDAILTRQVVFKVFVISNTSALCGYIFVLFCVLWAMMISQDGQDNPKLLLNICIRLLQLSFYGTLTAFASGAYTVISAESLWVAIVLVSLPASTAVFATSIPVGLLLAKSFCRL